MAEQETKKRPAPGASNVPARLTKSDLIALLRAAGQPESAIELFESRESPAAVATPQRPPGVQLKRLPSGGSSVSVDSFSTLGGDRSALPTVAASPTLTNQLTVALYDYEATRHDDLPLRRGDVVAVGTTDAMGWSWGTCGHRSGYFPASYVSAMPMAAPMAAVVPRPLPREPLYDEPLSVAGPPMPPPPDYDVAVRGNLLSLIADPASSWA